MHKLSPVELEFLLHCFYSHEPYPKNHPSLVDFRLRMKKDDILDVAADGTYVCTEKGTAWVNMILDTPYPVKKWMPGQQ